MADEKDSKQMLIDILYAGFDAGLDKRDAHVVADAIENLIDERINKMLERFAKIVMGPQ